MTRCQCVCGKCRRSARSTRPYKNGIVRSVGVECMETGRQRMVERVVHRWTIPPFGRRVTDRRRNGGVRLEGNRTLGAVAGYGTIRHALLSSRMVGGERRIIPAWGGALNFLSIHDCLQRRLVLNLICKRKTTTIQYHAEESNNAINADTASMASLQRA